MGERFREFDAYSAEDNADPIGFAIRGSKRVVVSAPAEDAEAKPTIEWEDFREAFDCLPVCPAGAMEHLGRGRGYIPFLMSVLVPEQRDRLGKLIDSAEYLIDHEVIQQVVYFLVEEYTGRPMTQPTGSPGGQQSTGDTSPASAESGA